VHQDPALADALASLALGAEVPEELWKAVAEVLAWAYALEKGGDYPKGVM
jgi:flagellar biosynthesis protein